MNISSNKYDYNIHKLLYDEFKINKFHIVVHNRTEHLVTASTRDELDVNLY